MGSTPTGRMYDPNDPAQKPLVAARPSENSKNVESPVSESGTGVFQKVWRTASAVQIARLDHVVTGVGGFEPPIFWFEARCPVRTGPHTLILTFDCIEYIGFADLENDLYTILVNCKYMCKTCPHFYYEEIAWDEEPWSGDLNRPCSAETILKNECLRWRWFELTGRSLPEV